LCLGAGIASTPLSVGVDVGVVCVVIRVVALWVLMGVIVNDPGNKLAVRCSNRFLREFVCNVSRGFFCVFDFTFLVEFVGRGIRGGVNDFSFE
jgi:hypothetical protein